MTGHRTWIGAGLALVLLALSLTGDGTGPFRGARIAPPAWSYGLALVAVLLLVALAGRSRTKVDVR